MAKSKKNINAFQEAMLNNTKMIGNDEKSEPNKEVVTKPKSAATKSNTSAININPVIYKKLEEMGKKYDVDPNILASKGLELVVTLENYWFDNTTK